MNRIVLIAYDLKPALARKGFFDAIKNEFPQWWHYLSHIHLVYTDKSVDDITGKLMPYVTENDKLFVTEITTANQGSLPEKAWEWINSKEAVDSTPAAKVTRPTR